MISIRSPTLASFPHRNGGDKSISRLQLVQKHRSTQTSKIFLMVIDASLIENAQYTSSSL
uniref:Uncharacterized protein n=1 Tax=Anguilla anguilla TaxID=7936 RepID=A0A0E9WE90_ANGAN